MLHTWENCLKNEYVIYFTIAYVKLEYAHQDVIT